MRNFQDLVSEVYREPFPGGISPEYDTLHAKILADVSKKTVRLYKEFHKKKPNLDRIRTNEELSQALDRLIEHMIKLRDHKRRYDELAEALIDVVRSQP